MADIEFVTPFDSIENSKDRINKAKKKLIQVRPINLKMLPGLKEFEFVDLNEFFSSRLLCECSFPA